MNHLTALLLGFCIDLLLGDPRWLYHPVQAIGALISHLEPPLRRAFPRRLRLAGAVLVIAVVAITGIVTGGLLFLLHRLHPVAGFVGETIVCWLILATKSLRTESMKVVKALETGTLDDGRKAVSMIVGRDTEHLSEEEVLKAAVETVAENASDGILAPLLFAAVLGPVGGMCYKAVNTMDSMVGYKNDRYLDFGRAAAKADDVFNFLPARISGFLMCLAAYLGFDGKKRLSHLLPGSEEPRLAQLRPHRGRLRRGAGLAAGRHPRLLWKARGEAHHRRRSASRVPGRRGGGQPPGASHGHLGALAL